jgi:metal-responsive CopG/Arc/MetJ family transcriptional regulator
MSRIKVSVTLDPELLRAVDRFVQSHPGQDRCKVIDQALQQWYAHHQDTAMEAQYARAETDVIGPERKASTGPTAIAQQQRRCRIVLIGVTQRQSANSDCHM